MNTWKLKNSSVKKNIIAHKQAYKDEHFGIFHDKAKQTIVSPPIV